MQQQQAKPAQMTPPPAAVQASTTGTAAAANDNPDTMKRIQQILDDYNQQIRNSPDLQTKPAPRRRIPVASPSSGSSDAICQKIMVSGSFRSLTTCKGLYIFDEFIH